MSGRVNVKFVVLLSAVLLVVMGGAVFGAAVVLMKSGADHARLAEKAEAEGDWKAAERSWGNAVSEERTNVEWLERYLIAIQNRPTDTPIEYSAQYEKYRAVLRSISEAKRNDLEAHENYFSEFVSLLRAGTPTKDNYQFLIDEIGRVEALLYNESDSDLLKHLRRYRGEAVAMISQVSSDITDEFLDGGIEDLRQASQVRPGDSSIVEALYTIYLKKAERARVARRSTLETEAYDAAHAAVSDFIQRNPDDLAGQFLLIRADMDKALRGLEGMQLFGPELSRARRRTLEGFKDRTDALALEAQQAESGEFSARAMVLITNVIANVDPENAVQQLEPIWARASATAPDDRRLQFSYAQFLKQISKHPEAIALLEKIADLPDVPVSTDGVLRFEDRNRALYFMADASIERWQQMASQTEGRAEWLSRARTYRDRLSEEVSTDRPMMLFLDARLAFTAGELTKADRLFREFNTKTNKGNIEGLKLAAEVARQLGNPGLEKDLLESARIIEPSDLNTLIRLANVHVSLRDYARAKQLLTTATDLRPDIPEIQEQLEIVRMLLDPSVESDPVKKLLAEAQLAQDQGTPDDAITILQDGMAQHPDNVLIIVGLSQMLNQASRYDEAKAVIERGLAIQPENRNLLAQKTVAEIGGDIGQQIEIVEQREMPELQRQLALHRLHLSNENSEAAAAALAAARALDPTDKQVVVYSFDEALRGQNVAEAKRIYEANKDRDIDGADGLAMRARVELAQGDKESARRTLQSAVDRGSVNAVTIRLLADVQMELGETFGALENYKRAIAVRPTDIELLKGYIAVLSRLGRLNEALDTARSVLSIGQRDEQFREMWLNLEGVVGNKQLAYDRRLTLAGSYPNNQRNTALLIGLALDLRKFDEARARLDTARAAEDSLLLASLDARWHADRNDLQGAIDVFSRFISSGANDLNDPSSYLTFGEFLIERGLVDRGLTTLRQAQLVQSADNPIADAVLANRLFTLRRYDEAVPVLRSMIDADFQPGIARGRLIECYIRLSQADLAQQVIDSASDEERKSLSMMLMQSDVAALRGENNKANQLIDSAIQAYPNDALGYMKRASRLMSNRNTMPDAIADLTRAIELNPANADAYRFRSLVHNELGRTDDSAKDIVASAEADPDSLQLRLGAIHRLVQLDREQMAADLADTGLKRRPTDLTLMLGVGDTFTDAKRHRTALRFYEMAWAQSKTFAVGQRLATCLVEQPRPDLRRARQIAQDSNLASSESAAAFMLRARIELAAQNTDGIRTNLSSAYDIVKDNPNQLIAWMGSLPEMLGSMQSAMDYLAALERERSLSPWATHFRAQLMLSDDAYKAEGMRQLTRVIDTVQDPNIRQAAFKVRAMARYGQGDFTPAADDMQQALILNPNDPEALNNLAYTLAKHLDQAAQAEPLAVKAVELNPNSRASLDTLGLVYLKLGKTEEAVSALQRALSMAQTDVDKAPVLVHLARALLASGNTGGAQEAASQARTIMAGDTSSAFSEEVRAELEQIQSELRNQ